MKTKGNVCKAQVAKVRCQCPAPAGYSLDISDDVVPGSLRLSGRVVEEFSADRVLFDIPLPGPVLHFKAADQICDKCGRAICRDCVVNLWFEYPWFWDWKGLHYVCRSCHDLFVDPGPDPDARN